MGKSKDLATGETRFVNTAGDTMTGDLQSTELVANNAGNNTNIRVQNTASGSGSSDGFVIQNATNSKVYLWNYENSDVLFGTNSIERLKIDASGRVTMPTQAYGEAEGLYGSSTSVSSGSIINWLTANHLNGGVTFSNNGRFTVPTAGRYLVHYRLYFYPNSPVSQYYQISLQKNGSEEDFMIDEENMTTYSGSGKLDRGLSFTTVIRLAASDYLELKYLGSATANFYRGGPHNKFKVLLLS